MSITKQILIETLEEMYRDPELRIMIYKLISNLECRNYEDFDEYRRLEDKILGKGNYVLSVWDEIESHARCCRNFDIDPMQLCWNWLTRQTLIEIFNILLCEKCGILKLKF